MNETIGIRNIFSQTAYAVSQGAKNPFSSSPPILKYISSIMHSPFEWMVKAQIPAIKYSSQVDADKMDVTALKNLKASVLSIKDACRNSPKCPRTARFLTHLDKLEQHDFSLINTILTLKTRLDVLDRQNPEFDKCMAELREQSVALGELVALLKALRDDFDEVKTEQDVKIRNFVKLTLLILAIPLSCVLITAYASLLPFAVPAGITTITLPLIAWAFNVAKVLFNTYDARRNDAWDKVRNDLLKVCNKLDDIKESIVLEISINAIAQKTDDTALQVHELKSQLNKTNKTLEEMQHDTLVRDKSINAIVQKTDDTALQVYEFKSQLKEIAQKADDTALQVHELKSQLNKTLEEIQHDTQGKFDAIMAHIQKIANTHAHDIKELKALIQDRNSEQTFNDRT